MASDPTTAVALLNEYAEIVDDAYALYLDSIYAMPKFATWVEETQVRTLELYKGHEGGPTTVEELDQASFIYGAGDPNDPKARVQHVSKQGELKARNREDGANCRTASRVLIITIYQFWEDHYRHQFAKAVDKASNEIQSDFFGDARHLRNDIIHHRNHASERILKCKVLNYFSPREEIYLNKEQVMEVMVKLRSALDHLCAEFAGVAGGFAARESVSAST